MPHGLTYPADKPQRFKPAWLYADYATPEEKIATITGIYNSLGIDKLATAKIDAYYAEALEIIASINLPEERKAKLREYASKMMMRQK